MYSAADSEVSVSTSNSSVYNYNAIRDIHISINHEPEFYVAYHQFGSFRLKTSTSICSFIVFRLLGDPGNHGMG